MKRVIILVMLVITTTGLGGQEAMYDHDCGVSRESGKMDIADVLHSDNDLDQIPFGIEFGPFVFTLTVEVGGLFTQHRRLLFTYFPKESPNKIVLKGIFSAKRNLRLIYDSEGNPAWGTEIVTIMINEEADFYYELALRNPDVASADEFKAEIKKILACRFGSYQMIDEADNFMEYEVNGQRYYHGFVIGRSLAVGDKSPVGSVEFVGMSSIENYDERRKLYVQTFTNNEAMLAEHIKSHGFDRIQ
ncbi:hypothetical protein PVA45_05100 [Entomospira entomophila]|uniref:Uncharacterized protein n=1 Tax=Entomospira entomophila TaxID=2719988 RepID=A0A968KWJ8_9SPIO|nr:hypothetical protein [Entomospira entomophilus]NIZ40875.1 hypothetical protein [Entomospira entomophilus]WDI35088.1 hypothetical protein PVA45_05100 [Entomospira entomophilus]